MEKQEKNTASPYELDGRPPLKVAIPLGLQHVLAMFVGNLTPLLIITAACGIEAGGDLQVALLQNAMLIAGIVTLVQVFTIGPVGGKLPIVMGTSSGFIGVCQSVAGVMGNGIVAYGSIMAACFIGGLFETVLGSFLKPLRKFFPSVVTGTVVLSIGLSLIGVGISSFGGGSSAKDYGSLENLFRRLCSSDRDHCTEAWNKRLHKLFFNPHRYYRGIHSGKYHGYGTSYNIYICR